MKKIKLLFRLIRLSFTNTSQLFKNLFNFVEDTDSMNIVTKKYKLPNGLKYVDLLDLFPEINETISHYSFLEGTSLISDIALLKLSARRFEQADYIEFGTWRGESIVNVAEITPNCTAISFSETEMKENNFHPDVLLANRFFLKGNTRIQNIEHNTQTYDFRELEGKFDIIFVDADHKYEGVKIDTRNAFKLLKNEHSVIIWHDCGKSTENNNWPVLAGILDGAPSDAHRQKIYRVSNTLCGIYTNQPVAAHDPVKYVPNKSFEIQLTAKRI